MGRITVFTGNDVNSKHALRELERRKLPYTEISLWAFPERLADLDALASEDPSVPQVFFNTRYVGGVDNTKKELRRWDRNGRYKTPMEKYEAEIATAFDPSNERLALPITEGKAISHASLSVLSPTTIALPDGTMTSVRDITEKLKNSISPIEIRRHGTLYRNVFTGAMVTEVFLTSLGLSEKEALKFGNTLMEGQVLQPLLKDNRNKKFVDDTLAHYRLQCFQEPSVLNSYCVWEGYPTKNPLKLSVDLTHLLDDIETSAIDKRGLLDYDKARGHELFPLFEESVCEIGTISMESLAESEKLAFALNVYLLMMRYAFFKIGIPLSESDRLHFMANVKFQVGGKTYTFDEWSDAVAGIKSQKKSKSKDALSIVSKADNRALFALFTGAANGSTHSLPFAAFTKDNLDSQLTVAAQVYLGDNKNLSVNRKKGSVELSNLFKLKKGNFGTIEVDMLEIILQYLEGKKKSDVSALISTQSFNKITYLEPTLGRHTDNSLWYEKEALEVDAKGIRGLLKRFRPPKMTKNERSRLATLHSLNLLDTLEEERYDRITRMAQTTFNVPLVFVSLVDQNRQWFKSTQWHTTACPRVPETGRDVSFCGYTVHNEADDLFVIENALEDERFADNPLVTGDLGIRFYAGYPLTVPSVDGHGTQNIGSFCIIDQKPRVMSEEEKRKFVEFGEMIKKEILRRDASSRSSGSTCDPATESDSTVGEGEQ